MKFLILNGPNLNIMRWSEPGVPGELDYNAIMDYVQAGCENSWALRPTAASPTTRATSWTKFRPQRAGWTASC